VTAARAPGLRVRRLRYRDLAEAGRIERAVFGTPWRVREFAFELSKPAGMGLAAVVDEDLAGYLVSCRQGSLWNLRNLAVAPTHRRRGIASGLLETFLEHPAVAQTHVFLEVRESESGAIALYARFGFRAVGRRPGFYRDNLEDAVLMWRSPSQGDGGRSGSGTPAGASLKGARRPARPPS